MKALVINTTRMGDLIQSTPLMQGFQSAGYEVTLLFSDGFQEIAGLLAGVDRLIPFSLPKVIDPMRGQGNRYFESYQYLAEILGDLRAQSFDLVVNATHSVYSAIMTGLIEGKKVSGLSCDGRGRRVNGNGWARYYLTSQSCRESNRFNLVDIHRKMGGITKPFPVRLNLPASSHQKANELLLSNINNKGLLKKSFRVQADALVRPLTVLVRTADEDVRLNSLDNYSAPDKERLIGIVPGASTLEKTLPAETFADVIRLLQADLPVVPVIFGAGSEKAVAGKLAGLLPDAINFCGATDVSTLAALIERCDVLVTNDTGPMHIAAAVGTKVVDISLGSALASETAPYGEGHYIIESRIDCHPCLPRMHCSHFSCGKSISAEIIARVVVAAMNGNSLELDGCPDLDRVNIYSTEFDADGFSQLKPLIDRPLEADEVLFGVMKRVWKGALGVGSIEEHSIPTVSDETAGRLKIRCEGFYSLQQISRIGAESCEELVRLADCPTQTNILQQLATAVSELDRQIARIAYARPEVMPFAMQFTSAKDNIRSTNLAGHAGQTARLFRQLESWCGEISDKISSVTVIEEGIVDAA